MKTTRKHLPDLADYVELSQLLPAVQHTFPTADSVRWFVRHHRDDLVRAGALIALGGRLRYHPASFQSAAVEIGRNSLVPDARP